MTRATDERGVLRELVRMVRFVLPLVLAGCVGEAGVGYQGVVLEGSATAYEFAMTRDPLEQVPIAGATVSLVVDGDERTSAMTDAGGNYPLLEAVFGGFVGHDTPIEVRVAAPDGRAFTYATIYEDTEDPTYSERSCEDGPCPTIYLNFALAPR